MIDPVAIQLGPISIRWYAICIVTGLVLAVYLAMKEAPRRKIIPDDIFGFYPSGFSRSHRGCPALLRGLRVGLLR